MSRDSSHLATSITLSRGPGGAIAESGWPLQLCSKQKPLLPQASDTKDELAIDAEAVHFTRSKLLSLKANFKVFPMAKKGVLSRSVFLFSSHGSEAVAPNGEQWCRRGAWG